RRREAAQGTPADLRRRPYPSPPPLPEHRLLAAPRRPLHLCLLRDARARRPRHALHPSARARVVASLANGGGRRDRVGRARRVGLHGLSARDREAREPADQAPRGRGASLGTAERVTATGTRPARRLCAIAVLGVGLLLPAGAARAAAAGRVVAWGCQGGGNWGQCNVPSGLTAVTAVAAGEYHSLALKRDGTVVAWGCGANTPGQCSVPSGLSGVTAIAAGTDQSLAVRSDGTVVACG